MKPAVFGILLASFAFAQRGSAPAELDVLKVQGNVGSEKWSYYIQFKMEDPSPSNGGGILDDAWGMYTMGNGWSIKFGQFKLPLFREELVGDTYLLFADRTTVNTVFSQRRSQGVQGEYQADQWRIAFAVSHPSGVST